MLLPHNNSMPRVLVVDDMATNRELVMRALKPRGYDVREATGGRQALAMINMEHFDVILLDIKLPDMNGLDVCRHLRENPDFAFLPIIAVTSLSDPKDIADGLNAGITEYVTKPFNFLELSARIKAVIEHKRVLDHLDHTEAVLFALARIVEAKDMMDKSHCDRLAFASMVFGVELGLSYAEIEALRRGGVLHDIGKLAIPERILHKKTPLSDDEWTILKKHPTIGAEICSSLRSIGETMDIVLYHHERWDGSGYPKGLKGENIPLLARVFQIVDVYEAMSQGRRTKDALEHEVVIETMEEETQAGFWDPNLMEKFLDIVRNRPEELEMSVQLIKDPSIDIFENIASTGVLDDEE